jgi:hypothetical protein
MLPHIGRARTMLKSRIGLSAMRLVTFTYLIFALLSLGGAGHAIAGHSWSEMWHIRDDAARAFTFDEANKGSPTATAAGAGVAPLSGLTAPHNLAAVDVPAANQSNLTAVVVDWLELLFVGADHSPDHQVFFTPDISALSELRQHLHRSVVLHL